MLKLRRINIERSEEVFERIKAYVDEVVRRLNPQLVILFGSFASGDINEGSDVDILVVADFKENFLDRIGTLMKLNTFGLPVEPLGYTPEEFEKMKRRRNPFILEVLEEGKILYKAQVADSQT
ncbi:MAG: nucleotidyltransferase domain-containing protein [Candidatus Bathyarchaeia archaeon]